LPTAIYIKETVPPRYKTIETYQLMDYQPIENNKQTLQILAKLFCRSS
jgi:hypothetical protein